MEPIPLAVSLPIGSFHFGGISSERDLQPELHLPLIGLGGCHFSKIGIAQRGAIVSAGPVEVWRVREIERLESELPANALGHAELAEHREIKVHEPWTIKDIARCCAISSGRGRRKHANVNPLPTGADSAQHSGCANQVWPIAIARRVEASPANPNVDRLAGVGRKNAIELPIA